MCGSSVVSSSDKINLEKTGDVIVLSTPASQFTRSTKVWGEVSTRTSKTRSFRQVPRSSLRKVLSNAIRTKVVNTNFGTASRAMQTHDNRAWMSQILGLTNTFV